MQGPSRILDIKSGIGIGIVTVGSNGLDLDVGRTSSLVTGRIRRRSFRLPRSKRRTAASLNTLFTGVGL